MQRNARPGFTLLELLVVVAIITVLISILVPSLSRAIIGSDRVRCLANQNTIAKAANVYAVENEYRFPPAYNGTVHTYATDYRQYNAGGANINGTVHGLGLLIKTKHLPTTKLGKLVHCPSIDTSGATGTGVMPKFGMDVVVNASSSNGHLMAGGSYLSDAAYNQYRIVGSYNYRALSYVQAKPGNVLKTEQATSSFVLLSDLPDARYGKNFCHKEGYNRVFGDGSGAFFDDPNGVVEKIPLDKVKYPGPPAKPNLGNRPEVDGFTNPGGDEEIYNYLSVQR